jgi:hypothetical protein
MKHIKTTSKIRRPEKAQVPILDNLVCAVAPEKEKCRLA